jgi:hypothetical protein
MYHFNIRIDILVGEGLFERCDDRENQELGNWNFDGVRASNLGFRVFEQVEPETESQISDDRCFSYFCNQKKRLFSATPGGVNCPRGDQTF